jgi:hypothetical protein
MRATSLSMYRRKTAGAAAVRGLGALPYAHGGPSAWTNNAGGAKVVPGSSRRGRVGHIGSGVHRLGQGEEPRRVVSDPSDLAMNQFRRCKA